uniref:4Fe-4S ferredoxin, iron-sulfur binding n=1 Tax=uncultured Thiotrichaceae bacterium TaxID=298394 RepID=A0A6S6TZA0_9GAMM|nr:MAG: 4Fe-4S ferredoxin, iron-sulfur binding [uncultured Thiotrichaceae bacterium]
MEMEALDEILEVMTGERTLFHYVRDGYALALLQDYMGDSMSINELRQSPYAHLLSKPSVKKVMAKAAKGIITAEQLEWAKWDGEQPPLNFVLTLDRWGDGAPSDRVWDQMSRSGQHLVLQLNFANDHQQRFRQLIKTDEYAAFSHTCHPVVTDGSHETLAWARIDLDLNGDVALIEEIQSDWVRQAKDEWNCQYYEDADFDTYLGKVLAPYAKVWDEAVLTAAIQLVRRELGINNVFYNTFETGNRMKGIDDDPPPRSLYTKLPRRFGFQETHEPPEFLQGERHLKKMVKQLDTRPKKKGGQKAKQGDLKKLAWFKLPVCP